MSPLITMLVGGRNEQQHKHTVILLCRLKHPEHFFQLRVIPKRFTVRFHVPVFVERGQRSFEGDGVVAGQQVAPLQSR